MIAEKKAQYNLSRNIMTNNQPEMIEKMMEQLQEPEAVGKIMEQLQGIIKLQQLYQAAIREISTKLEILDDEFRFQFDRNPIHQIESRMKTPPSIIEKLSRRGLDITVEAARESITDIAGTRVICSYVEDIYAIVKLLIQQDDIILLRETDYIKYPKPNGYRSLHLVVKVPVFLSGGKELVPVEIQIRTIAMDFWASLEHQLRYKEVKDIPEELARELKDCADVIAKTDIRMQNINHEFENLYPDCNMDNRFDLPTYR